MIVCQCKGITDASVRQAVREGAGTVAEVGISCRAGTECGGCHETIAQLIAEEMAVRAPAGAGAGRHECSRPTLNFLRVG